MSWQAIVCGFVVLGVIAIIVFWAMWSKASDAIKHDDDESFFQFTEAEIGHYGLQDCERVGVTDDAE